MITARTQATRPLTHAELDAMEAQFDRDLGHVEALQGWLRCLWERAYSSRGICRNIRPNLDLFAEGSELVNKLRGSVGYLDEHLEAVHDGAKALERSIPKPA